MFWNVFQPRSDFAEAFAAVYRRVLPDSPVFRVAMPGLETYSRLFDKAGDGIRESRGFGEPERWRADWERLYTKEEWLEQVPTFGGHSQLSPGKLEKLLAGMGTAIDTAGGSFTMGYAAVVVTAARNGAA